MKRLLTFCVAISIGSLAIAQNGNLTGAVTEQADPTLTVPFANVVLAGTQIGGTTDFDGNFNIVAPAGTYDVVFSFIGYKTDTLRGISIKAGETTSLNHQMVTESEVLGNVTVVAQANRESQSALIIEQRKADQIVQNMGAQKLSEVGASDVAAGLAKVSGVSSASSDLVVRGMGDRYNNALLNGLPIPTTNPDNKMPELDLFPTDIVKNLQVTKTFSPELYGDFAGGNINIETKTYSDEPLLLVGVGTGFNSLITGQNFVTSNGGATDYLGIDDGTRAVPTTAKGTPIYIAPNFNPVQKQTPLSQSFSFLNSNSYQQSNGANFGYFVSLAHDVDYSYENGSIRIFNLQGTNKLDYDFENWGINTQSSALVSTAYTFNTGAKISYNFVYANVSSDETRETRGSHFDYANDIFTRRFTYRENRVLVNQLHGQHNIGENTKFNWDLGYSRAFSQEPDRRQLVFFIQDNGTDAETYTPNFQDRIDNHRFWNWLQEDEVSLNANAKKVLNYTNKDEGSIKNAVSFGIQARGKKRAFDYQRFVYNLNTFGQKEGSNADIENLDQYFEEEDYNEYQSTYNTTLVTEQQDPSSRNDFSLYVGSGFVNYEHQVSPILKVSGGLRAEYSLQQLSFLDQVISNKLNEYSLDSFYVLPAVNAKAMLNENSQLKVSASQTVSRPKFKELTPFEYTEVFAGVKTRGNPELSNGTNYNLDVRYEFYPNHGEMISFTAFGKKLVNPIEKTMLATASGQLQSFNNIDGAFVAGAEAEFVKRFSSFTENSFLSRLEASANASYMYTRVSIEQTAGSVHTNTERPLQGASPFLLNADLTYKSAGKIPYRLTLAYNMFGERLYAAGIQGLGDQYEQGVQTLDFLASSEITERIKVGFKLRNLLNPTYTVTQQNNDVAYTVNEYKKGIRGSISVNISLN